MSNKRLLVKEDIKSVFYEKNKEQKLYASAGDVLQILDERNDNFLVKGKKEIFIFFKKHKYQIV